MALYVYQKAVKETPPPPLPTQPIKPLHLLPLLISFVGLLLIGFVVWPILSYELTSIKTSTKTASGLLNPLIEMQNQEALAAAPQVVNQLDFTKAGNWFPTANLNSISYNPTETSLYTVSIPKLKIENAIVRSDTLDLSKSLIHYPDTAMPGDLGSPVIFGHSILPQFYNPKNYMSIFSLLPSLSENDLIHINYDNITYTYQVTDKKEVYPTDLSPLQQQYDNKSLKLITCVPPGLKTRRLVVTAKLLKS